MLRRPPRSTRPDTLFPYTTLFRSYDSDTGKPLATAIRRRVYAKGPAWKVYLVNSDSVLFTAESGFDVRRKLRLHFLAADSIAAAPAKKCCGGNCHTPKPRGSRVRKSVV